MTAVMGKMPCMLWTEGWWMDENSEFNLPVMVDLMIHQVGVMVVEAHAGEGTCFLHEINLEWNRYCCSPFGWSMKVKEMLAINKRNLLSKLIAFNLSHSPYFLLSLILSPILSQTLSLTLSLTLTKSRWSHHDDFSQFVCSMSFKGISY